MIDGEGSNVPASCEDSAKHGVGSAERAEAAHPYRCSWPPGIGGTPGHAWRREQPGELLQVWQDQPQILPCPCRTLKCHNCGKLGHIKRVCRQKGRQRIAKHRVKTVQESHFGSGEDEFTVNQLRAAANHPLEVLLEFKEEPCAWK